MVKMFELTFIQDDNYLYMVRQDNTGNYQWLSWQPALTKLLKIH